jgi:predicted anti-sigma-YlaC factor YlaD
VLSCKETSHLVSQALDRRLTWRERLAVRLHLFVCDACRRFERQVAVLRAVARRYATLEPETTAELQLSAEAHARIARALRSE